MSVCVYEAACVCTAMFFAHVSLCMYTQSCYTELSQHMHVSGAYMCMHVYMGDTCACPVIHLAATAARASQFLVDHPVLGGVLAARASCHLPYSVLASCSSLLAEV